jgi:predicted acetyltransferase
VILRELTDEDWGQRRRLSGLAFGYTAPEEPPAQPVPAVRLGAFDGDELLAEATGLSYEQWWCGRPVPMCGIAGVAVHPHARGRGLVRELLSGVLARVPAPISVLYPTAPGIYRRLGWEVVGSLDETVVPLSVLPRPAPAGVALRGARQEDLPALHALYVERGRSGSGLLTREGPSFPDGPARLLEADVVTVAEEGGQVTGWVGYDRGSGYRHGGPLRVRDLLTATPAALHALLGSLGSWSAVVDELRWRGSTADLALGTGASLPAPSAVQPWMLRVVDPVTALTARGWLHDGAAAFCVDGQGWQLEVTGGHAAVLPREPHSLPVLDPRGLALLYAGLGVGRLLRAGLVDRPVPELALLDGPAPEIADYF